MNYKIEGAIKKTKKYFIISVILWLIIQFFIILPIMFTTKALPYEEQTDITRFVDVLSSSARHPIKSVKYLFKHNYGNDFFTSMGINTAICFIAVLIGAVKAAPKNEFSDIEHGSSDWSQSGEQYQILSKDKGIILSENNYLPVDKRGNVNVLVVGRIWIW